MSETPTADALKQRAHTSLQKATKPGTLLGLKSDDIQTVLEAMRPRIAQALPQHLSPERMIQYAVQATSHNPALKECTASSLIGAVMQASLLGFRPISSLGECYLVPYWNGKLKRKEVQFQIGYRGYVTLGIRSQLARRIFAYVVREGDEFDAQFGDDPHIKHRPAFNEDKPITHAYAVIEYVTGGKVMGVMTADQIHRRRKRNQMQKDRPSGAWKTDEEAMFRKTAIRNLWWAIPTSDPMAQHMAVDERTIDLDHFSNDRSGELHDAEISIAENVEADLPADAEVDTSAAADEPPPPEDADDPVEAPQSTNGDKAKGASSKPKKRRRRAVRKRTKSDASEAPSPTDATVDEIVEYLNTIESLDDLAEFRSKYADRIGSFVKTAKTRIANKMTEIESALR